MGEFKIIKNHQKIIFKSPNREFISIFVWLRFLKYLRNYSRILLSFNLFIRLLVYPGGKVVYFQRDELPSNEAQFDNDRNPLIKVTKESTEVEEAKAKYDNTKSPDYEKKRKALAKKHGGEENIKGHPQYEDYHRGTGEKVQSRTKKWMDKKG